MACFMVMALAPTEEPKAFATSLAPMPARSGGWACPDFSAASQVLGELFKASDVVVQDQRRASRRAANGPSRKPEGTASHACKMRHAAKSARSPYDTKIPRTMEQTKIQVNSLRRSNGPGGRRRGA